MQINQNFYQVMSFVSFGENGSVNLAVRAQAPTLEMAAEAVAKLGLRHYAIVLCVPVASTIPRTADDVLLINGTKLAGLERGPPAPNARPADRA